MDNTVLLKEIKTDVNHHTGNMVDQIILFGSRVKGNARDYSDDDIIIDVKLITKNELSTIKGKQPFIVNAFETGIQL